LFCGWWWSRCFGVCEWTGTTRESCNAIGIPCFLRGTVRVAGRCGCFEATHGMQGYVSAHSLIFANCSYGHSKCQLPWHYVSGLPACMIGDSVRWYPPAPLLVCVFHVFFRFVFHVFFHQRRPPVTRTAGSTAEAVEGERTGGLWAYRFEGSLCMRVVVAPVVSLLRCMRWWRWSHSGVFKRWAALHFCLVFSPSGTSLRPIRNFTALETESSFSG